MSCVRTISSSNQRLPLSSREFVVEVADLLNVTQNFGRLRQLQFISTTFFDFLLVFDTWILCKYEIWTPYKKVQREICKIFTCQNFFLYATGT